MATRYDLSWDADNRRWRFMHEGRRHVRSVRQLKKDGHLDDDCPETKEASYHGARTWQKSLLADLHVASLPDSHAAAMARLKSMATSVAVREAIKFVEEDAATGDPLHGALLESFLPKPTGELDPQPQPRSLTVGRAVEGWLEAAVKSRHRLGHICHREIVNHRYGTKLFRDWIGDETPLADIDEAKWLEFFGHLSELVDDGTYKPTYCKHSLRYTRDFLEHCVGLGRHPGLRNLRDRKMRIGISEPEKIFYTNAEIKTLLGKARGQTTVHLLLMLNCGFTQQDISDLHPDEVRLDEGRIVRKRSKGRKHSTVPVVNYKLWPATLRLLREHRSSDSDRFLVTKSGRPWVDKDGKDTDSIRTQFKYLQGETDIKKSLRSFRKTSANRLGKRPEYMAYQQYFLGHAPSSVAQRHYVEQADQPSFDRAIDWLKGELGIS